MSEISELIQREVAIFNAARRLPGDERSSYLDAACSGESAMRQRLDELLLVNESAAEFLEKPAGGDLESAAMQSETLPRSVLASEKPGDRIGRYKLLENIGEGGCGVVYVAEQTEPVRRRVALKVIKLGMDTKQVVARFEAERQALAMMDHPSIAKVFDAGATEIGRPYFVMELVRGIRITDYCDQNQLTTSERLELFIKVCQAIQHAHQKGIIHRDVKPSNILVALQDGVPTPKIIDFGIAKATEGRLTEATVYTEWHHFVGTPAYMSPEQAGMGDLDIDTRSDIYSLGVLLYELLVGRTPFDAKELMSSGLDAMRKTIREKEPLRPSTRLRQTKTRFGRRSAPPSREERAPRVPDLATDLDWIVMKCLDKDRARRYETANGLASDLRRHLNNEPVTARPPSASYGVRKFVRRNKVIVSASAIVAGVLVLGIVASTWQAIRATRAERTQTRLREAAQASEQKVKAAEAGQTRLREQAQAEELAARQRAYASDMNVAKQALAGSNLGRAQELLARQLPRPGQKDLRGWEWRYLWQQTRSDALFTLCQKKSEIQSLAVSADGNWLAIGLMYKAKDGVSVWDLKTRREIAHLAAGEGHARAAFSPTDPFMAFAGLTIPPSGKAQASLRLWNTATRQVVSQFPLDNECRGLAFSKDGRTLVTSTVRGNITLWRVSDGTKLVNYPCEQDGENATTDFAATSDLGLAAYGMGFGRVRVMDLRDGKELWTVVAANAYVTALAFSPDGKTLASAAGYAESDIRLWDVATGKEIGRLEGHKSWVSSLVFWPDGKKLVSSSADQTIRTWDVASRKCLDVLRGHRLEVWRLALLPDNKTLVSGSKDGVVCVWDTSVTHPRWESVTWQDKIYDWRFAPNGRSVVTLDYEHKVTRWSGSGFQHKEPELDIGTNHGASSFPPEPDVGTSHDGSSFSLDCRFLALGSTNGNISVWDLTRRVLFREFKLGDARVDPLNFLAQGNRLLVWSSADNRFSEWDLEANRQIQSWPAPANFAAFGLSPDEGLGVGLGDEGDVSCRNLRAHSDTTLPLDVLEGQYAAFSQDGERLAVASGSGFARVWRTVTWREEATLRGFLNGVLSVAFSPDGKRLATGGSSLGDAVKCWDVDSWQEVLTLEGTGTMFDLVAFSPDGNAIGTKGIDGILQVWQAPGWEEIAAAEAKEKAEIKQP